MKQTPIMTAVWYIPQIVGGLLIGTIGGATLHHFPGRVLFVLSGVGHIMAALLFAIMPRGAGYWPYVFPAMICSTIGIDITYTVSNIFITTNLPARHQGLAGAVINSLMFLGISFWLGIADVAVGATEDKGLRGSYQSALWLGTALPGVGTLIFLSMKIGYAKSDLTLEEREKLEAEARATDSAAAADLPTPADRSSSEETPESNDLRRHDTIASRASRSSRLSGRVDRQITFHP